MANDNSVVLQELGLEEIKKRLLLGCIHHFKTD